MNMKIMSFALTLLIVASGCAKKDNGGGSSSAEKRTQQITQEVKEKELEVIQEKSRDAEYGILMDARMGLTTKVEASQDLMSTMNEMIDRKDGNISENKEILTDEFSLRMGDIYSQINFRKLNPLKVKGHYESSFYAMAASLDGSFYEIMKSALRKDAAGRDTNTSESNLVIQDTKQMTLDLIQARVDILSVFALQNLTDKKKMSFWQKTKSFAFNISGGLLGSIEYPETYAEASKATKNEIEDHLSKAVEAKNFLRSLGIEKKLNKKMRSAYKEIDFGEKKASLDNKDAEIDQRKMVIKEKIYSLLN